MTLELSKEDIGLRMSMAHLLFLCHLASTLYMTGLIWFVQVVHYPLHGKVGTAEFLRYQQLHMQWTSWVVMPPMLVELGTMLYFLRVGHANLPSWFWWSGTVLLGIIWVSTGVLQVPTHAALVEQFTAASHQRLVTSNWIRTIGWTARSILLLWGLHSVLVRMTES